MGLDFVEVGRLAGALAASVLRGTDPATIPIRDVLDEVPRRIILNTLALKGLNEPWRVPEEARNNGDDPCRRDRHPRYEPPKQGGAPARVRGARRRQAAAGVGRKWPEMAPETFRMATAGALELRIRGRLDGYWADHLQDSLAETMREGHDRIRLDLSDVSFMSSAGIGVLMRCYKQLQRIDGSLVIIRPSPQVRTVLEMTGLADG